MRAFSVILMLALAAFPAQAFERVRPLRLTDLPVGTIRAPLRRVKGARVAALNLHALLRDFPGLRRFLPTYPSRVVDGEVSALCHFLEQKFALVSDLQGSLTGIRNTAIPFADGPSVDAFRFPTYGRAAVVPVYLDDVLAGFFDMKGVGHGPWNATRVFETLQAHSGAQNDEDRRAVRSRGHFSGLLSLPDGFREMARQIAVQNEFEFRGLAMETVETYFVLELPFDVLGGRAGDNEPAAIYVRQAHYGRLPMRRERSRIPWVLSEQLANFQKTAFGSMVDFESVYLASSRFPWFPVMDGLRWYQGQWATPERGSNWQQPWGRAEAAAFRRTGDRAAVQNWLKTLVTPTGASRVKTLPEAIDLESLLRNATRGPFERGDLATQAIVPGRWVEWFREAPNARERARRAELFLQATLSTPGNLSFPIYVTQYALQRLSDREIARLVPKFPASDWEDFFSLNCRTLDPDNNRLLVFDLFRLGREVVRYYRSDRSLEAEVADYFGGQEDASFRWNMSESPALLRWLMAHHHRAYGDLSPEDMFPARGFQFRAAEQNPEILLRLLALEDDRDAAVRAGAVRLRRSSRTNWNFMRLPAATREAFRQAERDRSRPRDCGTHLASEGES